MRLIRTVGSAVLCSCMIFAWSNTADAAHATFKQKILPLDCVFQEVNDGLGTLIYLTPEECGQVIPPPDNGGTGNSGGGTPTPSTSDGQSSTPSTTTTGGNGSSSQPISHLPYATSYNLDLMSDFRSSGYITVVHPGQTYHFLVNDGEAGVRLVRIYIQSVSSSGVQFSVSDISGFQLAVGEEKRLDVNADQQVDVSLTVIDSSSRGATVRFKRLTGNQLVTLDSKSHSSNTPILIASIITSVGFTIVVYSLNRRLLPGSKSSRRG